MAYSRWSDSRWYTYWSVNGGPTKEEQLLDICLDGHFTYKQLREDMDGCLKIIHDRNEQDRLEYAPESPPITVEEMQELRGYMEIFLQDVDQNYERFMATEVANAQREAMNQIAKMLGFDDEDDSR